MEVVWDENSSYETFQVWQLDHWEMVKETAQ